MSSRLGHTRRHLRVHGASEPSVRGGSHACTKGGHATCKVQRRMRGRAHRHTTRHTTRCGALGRIARRRSAPSGVVGFRRRRAGCPKLQILGCLGLLGRRLHARATSEPQKPRSFGAYGPMSSRLGHMRWHMRVHGASEPSVCGGPHACTKGGHATCEVQPRMRGRAHRQTTRHTTRCGALGRIARRGSARGGVVGFRRRRAGRPKLQIFGAVWGPFGAAPTRTGDIRTAKTAMMRGE